MLFLYANPSSLPLFPLFPTSIDGRIAGWGPRAHGQCPAAPTRSLNRKWRVLQEAQAFIQRSAKVGAPSLVNFITAVAYHFCSACLKHSRNLEHRLCTCIATPKCPAIYGDRHILNPK